MRRRIRCIAFGVSGLLVATLSLTVVISMLIPVNDEPARSGLVKTLLVAAIATTPLFIWLGMGIRCSVCNKRLVVLGRLGEESWSWNSVLHCLLTRTPKKCGNCGHANVLYESSNKSN